MSLLSSCPGGKILQAPIPVIDNTDLRPFLNDLIDGLTQPQTDVFNTKSRYKMLACGRRWGKTHYALVQLITWAVENRGSLNWYVACTYRSAKSIAWRQLKYLLPPNLVIAKNEQELSLELVNGSRIELKGAESADTLRGVSLSNVVIDEAAYVHPDAWPMVLRPALSDQQGGAVFISTPCGMNSFHERFELARELPDWATFQYTTLEGGNVPPEEIESARRSLDERSFAQEYLSSFVTLSGLVFPTFSDDNIADSIEDLGGQIGIGLDFNVSIMAGVIFSKAGDVLHIWDEIALPDSNTDEVALMLSQRFKDRDVTIYPDPTGKARKTSAAGLTDHGILKKHGLKVVAPKAPWSVKDKLNSINYLVKNAAGDLRLFLHPRCKCTIKSLRNLSYKY